MAMCKCGEKDCWDEDDYSWLASKSGWHGTLHGCRTSVFFIHGKRIREQRHIPTGYYDVASLPALLAKWSEGLPNARLSWCQDTGDGDASLWIEGVRDPDSDDVRRLEECRERQRRDDTRSWYALVKRYGIDGPQAS